MPDMHGAVAGGKRVVAGLNRERDRRHGRRGLQVQAQGRCPLGGRRSRNGTVLLQRGWFMPRYGGWAPPTWVAVGDRPVRHASKALPEGNGSAVRE